jgi:hypothetical protein
MDCNNYDAVVNKINRIVTKRKMSFFLYIRKFKYTKHNSIKQGSKTQCD